jgi:hypothetical protein
VAQSAVRDDVSRLPGDNGNVCRRMICVSAMLRPIVVTVFALLELTDACAGSRPSPYVAPSKHGINKDAMTMQECRDRLAAPANERPPSDDPRIHIDGMCRNMLSMDKAFLDSQKAKAASSPSVKKAKTQAGSQPHT